MAIIASSEMQILHFPPSPFQLLLSTSLGLLIASEANGFYFGSAVFKICASLSFVAAGVVGSGVTPSLHLFAALGRGLPEYRSAITLALIFSLLGDIFLIPSPTTYYQTFRPGVLKTESGVDNGPDSDRIPQDQHEAATMRFKLGTFFFSLAHVAYIIAFLSSATLNWTIPLREVIQDPTHFRYRRFFQSLASSLFVANFLGLLRQPHDDQQSENSRLVVPNDLRPLLKIYVGIIIAMVSIATATDDGWQKVIGAWLFMISDLFVAVDVFGRKMSDDNEDQRDRRSRPGWGARSVGWVIYFYAQMLFAGTI